MDILGIIGVAVGLFGFLVVLIVDQMAVNAYRRAAKEAMEQIIKRATEE